MMPWSPSSVADYLACPRLWYLKRQGVVGRVKDTTAMDMGTEFHKQMADHWNGTGLGVSENETVEQAVRYVLDECEAILEEKGVIGVEVDLGNDPVEAARHGRYPGTCDLVTQNATGLTVTDYKTKSRLLPQYVDGELRETQRSWQLKQYAWFVQEQFKTPVTTIRKLLVSFNPLNVWMYSHDVTQESLKDWYKQALTVWHDMDTWFPVGVETDTRYVPQNPASCERFGWQYRCDYYGVCWEGENAVAVRSTDKA